MSVKDRIILFTLGSTTISVTHVSLGLEHSTCAGRVRGRRRREKGRRREGERRRGKGKGGRGGEREEWEGEGEMVLLNTCYRPGQLPKYGQGSPIA